MNRFSRSHIEAWFECPRLRYLTYHHEGKGIIPAGANIALATGTLTHQLLEIALGLTLEAQDFPPRLEMVNKFRIAIAEWKEQNLLREFLDFVDEDLTWKHKYEVERQAALAEALARTWIKLRLPVLLDQYELIDVEREFSIPLPGDAGEFMMRIDGVLRSKRTGEFCPLEFKTTGSNYSDVFESFRYDTQTMGHCFGVEHYYGPAGPVLMEFLYKGQRRNGEYYSPLIRGYKKETRDSLSQDLVDVEYSSEYKRTKGWEKFDVWKEDFPARPEWMSPIEYWVEHTLGNDVLMEQLFFCPVFRDMSLTQEWIDQTSYLEADIAKRVERVSKAPELLPILFPAKRNRHCFKNRYHRKCPMFPICYNEIDLASAKSGQYVEREPHHEQEFD